MLIITSNTLRNFSFESLQEGLQMKMIKIQMLSVSVKTEYRNIDSIISFAFWFGKKIYLIEFVDETFEQKFCKH